MTTGNSSIGSYNTDLWFWKNWSGADAPLVFDAKTGRMVRDRKVENPYQMSSFRRTRTTSTYELSPGSIWTGYNMPPSGLIDSSLISSWGSNDELKLLSKLEEAVRGHDFNAGVFASTAPEAVRGISAAAFAVRDAWKSVHRGDIDGFFRSISRISSGAKAASSRSVPRLNRKDISSTWLSLTYGWLPLISDIHDFFEAMEVAAGNDRGFTFTVRHGKSQVIPITSLWYTANAIISQSVRLKCRMREHMSVGTYWGINDPLSIAWELLPYSFVVDWFIPIGDYLSARSFIGSIKASYVRSYIKKSKVVDYADNPAPLSYKLISGASYSESSVELKRTVLSDYPVPTPDLKSLRKALSKDHLLNGAALINNLVGDMRSVIPSHLR